MRYENPQLVVLHCFVASFGLLFCVFQLARSTCGAAKIFVKEMQGTVWLICSVSIQDGGITTTKVRA